VPYRITVIKKFEATPRPPAAQPQIKPIKNPVSQRLTAMCGGKAAEVGAPLRRLDGLTANHESTKSSLHFTFQISNRARKSTQVIWTS
jgi:hypothetical protein